MARGELFLSSGSGISPATILYLTQFMDSAGLHTVGATYAGVQDITRTFSKQPIVIPLPDQEPMGFDLNIVESDTISIQTMWFDGTGATSTYKKAEAFFIKRDFTDKMQPYILTWGENTYSVMLDRWVASQQGGHGDTLSVSINLMVVSSITS